jgi:hypothetical protein
MTQVINGLQDVVQLYPANFHSDADRLPGRFAPNTPYRAVLLDLYSICVGTKQQALLKVWGGNCHRTRNLRF